MVESGLMIFRYQSARPCSRTTASSESNKIQARGTMEQYLNMDRAPHQPVGPLCSRVTMQSEPNYVKGQGECTTALLCLPSLPLTQLSSPILP